MKKHTLGLIAVMTSFISTSVFAAAPINDLTIDQNYADITNSDVHKQLLELSRLLKMRNKMQVRLQSQLDELSQEVSEVKGSIELFNHKLEQVEDRQRNLYQLVDDQSKSTVATVKTENTNAAAGDDKDAYQKALNLVLVNKEYTQAVTAFEAFVIDHPKSTYIANSYYWLGQLLHKEQKLTEARAAFMTVVEKHATSNKYPDALYKVGFIDEVLGKIPSAKSFYTRVVSEFPNGSAAGLAKKRLANL